MDVKGLLDDLAGCVCAAVNSDNSLCFCGILVGTAPYNVTGECKKKCGQAWVRLVSAYPSTVLGEADLTDNNCGKSLGLDIEIGVMRCFPIKETYKTEDLLAVSDKQVADMLAMRQAILCCDFEADVILGEYTPLGPEGEGGHVGGVWNLSVGD